ncbi:S-methyl-5-thioribose-1-phosphate isomerase [soil metagenome]
MQVGDRHYRTVWFENGSVRIIDQRKIPFSFELESLETLDHVVTAIAEMHVRGAGCIGATAGYGMALAARTPGSDMAACAARLAAARPTAVNLRWAVDRVLAVVTRHGRTAALAEAEAIADEDAASCRAIGEHGLPLIGFIAATKPPGAPVNILTHCNAGWLAFTDYGSATAPIYAAHRAGIPVHVWVDETRPRNQGARLTAWELANEGVPHTVIVDNAGGHLMQHGQVDLCITGTDRTTHTGDVANKIGTYLKALAAKDNGIPFYVALPSSTFDWQCRDGVAEIPIEERGGQEVAVLEGRLTDGTVGDFAIVPEGTPVANYAFDVTPARLVTALITERGTCPASEAGIARLFPDKR